MLWLIQSHQAGHMPTDNKHIHLIVITILLCNLITY